MKIKGRNNIIKSINDTMSFLTEIKIPKQKSFTSRNFFNDLTKIHQLKFYKDSLSKQASIQLGNSNSFKGSLHKKNFSLPNVDDKKREKIQKNFPITIKKYSDKKLKVNLASTTDSDNDKNFSTNSNNNFCPFCPHCNPLKSKKLDEHLSLYKEAKNVIAKGCDYLMRNIDVDNLDKLCQITSLHRNELETIDEDTVNKIDKYQKGLDQLIASYPRPSQLLQNRGVYKILTWYLDMLIENKVTLSSLIPKELAQKLNERLLTKGELFDLIEEKIIFDPEINDLFDNYTKENIEKLFKKKYLTSLNELKKKNEEKYYESIQKYFLLYLVFVQMLTEISKDSRDKAILLYKFFIIFFAEQDKKWISVVNKIKEKVKYYKKLAKTILQQKNKHIERIEDLNEALFSNKLTAENLKIHKDLINQLLGLVNEKRETIFRLESEKSILENELKFWIYDFENIKFEQRIRELRKNIKVEELKKNIEEELKYKALCNVSKSLLINGDIFVLLSEQRTYFYDQKKNYLADRNRLMGIIEEQKRKKKQYKKLLLEHQLKYEKAKLDFEKNYDILSAQNGKEKLETGSQTDIDFYKFNKLIKNNDLVLIQKKLSQTVFRNMVERIQYNCSRVKPLSKESLLLLIPDVYQGKNLDDMKSMKLTKRRLFLDEFLVKFFKEKFKIQKLVKKHCEETIASAIKNSSDTRINLFRRFLGIGNDKLPLIVLDIYLTLLNNIPISFSKLFDEEINFQKLKMDTDFGFEILSKQLSSFQLVSPLKDLFIMKSKVYETNKRDDIKVPNSKKKEIYFLMRMGEKNVVFFNDLIENDKNGIKSMKLDVFVNKLIEANKVFDLKEEQAKKILKSNFEFYNENEILINSFLQYYTTKLIYRIEIYDYIDCIIKVIILLLKNVDRKVRNILAEENYKEDVISYVNFQKLLLLVTDKNVDLKFQVEKYFTIASHSENRDFISQEEFTAFIVNSKDILKIIIQNNPNIINTIDLN